MAMKKILMASGLALGVCGAASAQKVVADKIVGIVGDQIILKSDIDGQIDQARRQDALTAHPELGDPCYQMQMALTTKALVLQAEKDSIQISDEEIEDELDLRIRNFIQMYGSKEILEQVAQRTIYQIKDDFREAVREEKLAEEERKKIVEDVTVTPSEVEDYFSKIPKDSLPFFESEMQIGEIVIIPKSNLDLDQALRDELNEYKGEVERGTRSFELLADLHSDDPGAKANGGLLQINRTDKNIDPIFLNAAFRLKEGQVSPVIKAKDGYDIIQMVQRDGDDATVRYILKAPEVTDLEINAAKSRLDSIRSRLIAGTIAFGQAVALYSEDDNSKDYGGLYMAQDGSTIFTYDALGKDMVQEIKNLKVGEYSQPVVFQDRLRREVRILYLKSRTDPHRENMRDDYNTIADAALNKKKNEVFQKWVLKHIPSYYVMLDSEYDGCPDLQAWASHAAQDNQLAQDQPVTPSKTKKGKSGN